MTESARVYAVKQILEWNSIPLIIIGGFTTLSFSMAGLFGVVLLGFGIYALVASSRLKGIPSSNWSHAIVWSTLITFATAVPIYFCVIGSDSWLSMTMAILLTQSLAALAVLFLSIGNNRGSDSDLGCRGNVR